MSRNNHDHFAEFLPVLLGKPDKINNTTPEITSADLHGKRTKKRFRTLNSRLEALASSGAIASGGKLKMLYSGIGHEYRPSKEERDEHRAAAEGLKRTLVGLYIPDEEIQIEEMTRKGFEDALLDDNIGHLLYIGHANRSRISDETGQSLNWFEHPELTHLKKSFGVLGCASTTEDKYYPRFGSTFVDRGKGIIYGVEGDYLEVGQPYSLDQLVPLKPTLHPTGPLSHTSQISDRLPEAS